MKSFFDSLTEDQKKRALSYKGDETLGMFDILQVKCPSCGDNVTFQSKAGPCEMATYHPSHVPAVVANDLNGKIEQCRSCEQYVVVRIPGVLSTVAMSVEIT